jgi:hypothetical protein
MKNNTQQLKTCNRQTESVKLRAWPPINNIYNHAKKYNFKFSEQKRQLCFIQIIGSLA